MTYAIRASGRTERIATATAGSWLCNAAATTGRPSIEVTPASSASRCSSVEPDVHLQARVPQLHDVARSGLGPVAAREVPVHEVPPTGPEPEIDRGRVEHDTIPGRDRPDELGDHVRACRFRAPEIHPHLLEPVPLLEDSDDDPRPKRRHPRNLPVRTLGQVPGPERRVRGRYSPSRGVAAPAGEWRGTWQELGITRPRARSRGRDHPNPQACADARRRRPRRRSPRRAPMSPELVQCPVGNPYGGRKDIEQGRAMNTSAGQPGARQ